MQWYYLQNGQRQGPVDDAALEFLVRQGTVQDDTLVWREGLTEWHPYGSVKPKPAPAPPQPAPAPFQPEPASVQPEPASVQPEPAPARPEPAPYRPETVRPEPVQPRPEPMHTRPEPVASPQPGPQQSYAPPRPEPQPSYSPAPGFSPTPGPSPAPAGFKPSHGAFFFYPVLDALSDGRVIRKVVVICLKIGAFLAALGGLLMALTVLTAGLKGTGTSALGGILFLLVLLVTAACVAQIFWYRAGSVAALEHSPRNTVIAIFSILSRASGEAAAAGFSGLGVGVCLFLWLAADVPLNVLPSIPYAGGIGSGGGFVGGVFALIYLVVLGFSSLIFGYLWAECLMLLVDIERNTRARVS